MRSIVIYNVETGMIRQSMVIDEDLISLNLKDGEAYIDGAAGPNETHVVDGQLVDGYADRRQQDAIDQAWIDFREYRKILLLESDWTQAADSPLTDAKKAEWATYRQQLRDLPANTTDPANPTWPTPPS
jgi:hypothetical protein